VGCYASGQIELAGMLLNRFVLAIKNQSRETLRAWSYQCESIFAQRSRRIQQLFSFYQSVYGTQGLKQLWRAYYRRELQPPLRGMVMSAVGLVGLNIKRLGSDGFDWNKERLALSNFDMCRRDIEFINALPHNQLCERCHELLLAWLALDERQVGRSLDALAPHGHPAWVVLGFFQAQKQFHTSNRIKICATKTMLPHHELARCSVA